MTPVALDGENKESAGSGRLPAAVVLADRLAAALVHHEPGWRLPRLTALARRYCVGSVEIDAAVDELVARRLVRRLPDGQVYRASPAEYWIPLEGIFGLTSHVDPMGGQLACQARQATIRRPPEYIARSLRLASGELVHAVRCVWTVGGEPGALTASYLPQRIADELGVSAVSLTAQQDAAVDGTDDTGLFLPSGPPFPRWPAGPDGLQPGAFQLEMGLPPPSAARRLRLAAGQPATMVTVSFADSASGSPMALTMAMLRPELFRIVVEAAPSHVPADRVDGLANTWTHLYDGQEP